MLAAALGLTVPLPLLGRADEVINKGLLLRRIRTRLAQSGHVEMSAYLSAFGDGRVQMKIVLSALLALVLFATEVSAADNYQLIPLSSEYDGTIWNDHYVLIVNLQTGETGHCWVSYNRDINLPLEATPQTRDRRRFLHNGCTKSSVDIGQIPPGPAVLSPLSHAGGATDPAIWKIDQSTGKVTFCGAAAWNERLHTIRWQCIVLDWYP